MTASNKRLLALGGILLVVFLVFSPTLKNGFVNWDDDVHLTENASVRSLTVSGVKSIFTTTVNKTYIPLTELSFAVERAIFGLDPFYFHLDNLLLHLAVTALVFLFFQALGLDLKVVVIATLLFGIHPMRVESVAWVTERKDVLYAFFYMLALLNYCGYLDAYNKNPRARGTAFRFFQVMMFGLLSALAKPMAVSLPLILLLLDWYKGRKISVRILTEKMPVFLLMLPVIGMTYMSHMRGISFEWPQSALIGNWCFVFYFKKFLWPAVLLPLYALPRPVGVFTMPYAASVSLTFVLLALVVWLRRKRIFIFSILFYLLSIFFLLRLDIRADANIVADRFSYLPSLGFCLIVAVVFNKIFFKFYNKPVVRKGAVLFLVVIFAVLGTRTAFQTLVWRNGATLWAHQLRHERRVATALVYCKLGEAMVDSVGDHGSVDEMATDQQAVLKEAIVLLGKSVEIRKDYDNAYYYLGKAFLLLGDFRQAEQLFYKALYHNSNNFNVLYELGGLYQDLKRDREAIMLFGDSLARSPDNPYLFDKIYAKVARGEQNSHHQDLYREFRQRINSIFPHLLFGK